METEERRLRNDAVSDWSSCIVLLEKLADESDQPDVMRPCVDRLNKIVLKVATLIAMAEQRIEVSLPDMLAAIALAERWYSTLIAMVQMVGQSEFSAQVNDLVTYLQGKGGRAKLYVARRHFNGMEPRRWNDVLAAAKEQKWITQVTDVEDVYLVVAS